MAELCDDLIATTADLETRLDGLDERSWHTPTPAEGWDVTDQVSHLAYFDEAATMAATDPERFRAEREEVRADVDAFTATIAARYHDWPGDKLLAWSREARGAMVDALRALDPSLRVPWYGPDMSAASSVTARIMETFAHGQDIADALGVPWTPARALPHVAYLGVRAIPNSYRTRGLPVPETEVRVDLVAPDGSQWAMGPEDSADAVRGPMLDFCRVVTQRRHVDDTDLVVTGPVATEWMAIAQAFAGPPGGGRRPGQFGREGR
jgi:uncharacterized protein (TIGR03084 family)